MTLQRPAQREQMLPATTAELRTFLGQIDTTACDAVTAQQCEQLHALLGRRDDEMLPYTARQQVRTVLQNRGIPFVETDEAGIHPHARQHAVFA